MLHSSLRKAFTLIELLVVIAIIAILAAILFPVFAQAKAAAKKTVCLSNEKQIALGAIMYSNDYDDMFPLADTVKTISPGVYAVQFWWYAVTDNYNTTPITSSYTDSGGLIQPYIKNSQIDGCPMATGQVPNAGPGGPPTGIANNDWVKIAPTSSFDSPASTIMLADEGIVYGTTDYSRPVFVVDMDDTLPSIEGRHAGQANLGWCDGHAKSMKTSLGDFATDNAHNIGWVFPPGVGSATDPRMMCYYLPIDSYLWDGFIQLNRPDNCPQ